MSVRQRRYVVTDVAAAVAPVAALAHPLQEPEHLVTLSSVEDDGLGEELQVIWEIEPGARIIEDVPLPKPTGLDDPTTLDAFLDAVRWGAASSADVKSLQAPFRSGIDIEDYQLDPVVRAIRMPRANLLIADDVGLGKTIEAGLVLLELLLRHRARRMLVVCPSGLQLQWRDQMRDKFGLEFRIVDSSLFQRLRRERGVRANPWEHFPRLITSIDFLKRDRPLQLFRETLPAEGETTYPRRYDVLVVDEAHNCAPSGRGKYATDSQRTQALRLLVPHFEHKLFLTATPHNGYVESFSALLELLDSQRFARSTDPDRKQLETVMVRRLKSELPPNWDGTPRFPKRVLEPLEVAYPEEERAVHKALERYTKLRQTGFRDQAERFATEFVLKILKKRLFSSPAAFLATLNQHEASLKSAKKRKAARPTVSVLQRQVEHVEDTFGDDERYDAANDEVLDAASLLFRDLSTEEAGLLKQMRAWAERATGQRDEKAKQLLAWLNATLRPGGKWNDARVIIFTEYRATQSWLQKLLASEGLGGDRLNLLYGGMDLELRETVKAAFQYDPKGSPVRILLATDSASEGIDLQNHCSQLLHYEIPWNPNRMEQRNGRIDRHGQKAHEVRIYHFVGKGYLARRDAPSIPAGDLEGDLEFLMRAAEKVERIREDLGKVGPVIAAQVEEAMLGHRTKLDTGTAERDAEPARRMLKFERNMRNQIERLRIQLDDTRRELRLEPANIQKVVDVALELAGQPDLIATTLPGKRKAFHLPSLSGSWALSAEGLTHPHTGETRAIVFDPNDATGRDDVVLAHLNHRLVQMALRLLRAEVWATEGKQKLHRITARLARDADLRDPVLVAHARLVVIGGDRHRLHEEIIQAAGTLKEGRFTALNVGETQRALDAALPSAVPEAKQAGLLASYGTHSESLGRALESRMRERTKGLEKLLAERHEKETTDVRTILAELTKTIQTELAEFDAHKPTQTLLFEGWTEPERQQLTRNIDALRLRLREIPTETEREVEAIAARFANPQPRMFPVAVTLLLPERLARP